MVMYQFATREELEEWIRRELVTSTEAIEILGGSRQNLYQYVQSGRLVPVKESGRDRLFWRSDVLGRKEQADAYKASHNRL